MRGYRTGRLKNKLGYTMMEVLAVVGIIAVICAIAVPSLFAVQKSLDFKQRNDYAKSIFMAAQANLTELRSDGALDTLRADSGGNLPTGSYRVSTASGFPEEYAEEYVYTTSADTTVYDLVLPVNSVESVLRDQQVIIEYNPLTGNVFAVYYSEDPEQDIAADYTGAGLPRNGEGEEEARKDRMLGYYEGSGLLSSELEREDSAASLVFENGEEALLTVKVPMPSSYYGEYIAFMEGLRVHLTILGDDGGILETIIKESGASAANCTLDADGRTVSVTYVLDSLKDYSSFANLSVQKTDISLTSLQTADLIDKIKPGDNITIVADVELENGGSDPAVEIEPAILGDINPMFGNLTADIANDGKFILKIENGRNMQNLNALHPEIAANISQVVFAEEINWETTVSYYNGKYGSYSNDSAEAPARALPYFVPIHNEALFGAAYFSYSGTEPVLTDEAEAAQHAAITGQEDGSRILYLNIDTSKYTTGKDYYAGTVKTDADRFAGLFGYVNTTVDNLYVVNPIVKGSGFTANNNPAAGALVGVSGVNSLITDCGVYLDTADSGFSRAAMSQQAYDESSDQNWYGVSGSGAVGGLVGYAKSHRYVEGAAEDDTDALAFTRCFAAVNVSGQMRTDSGNDYGYSNGVGGLIGNSRLTNFYGCYASGNVMASGGVVTESTGAGLGSALITALASLTGLTDEEIADLSVIYDGGTSMGVGGFVGTSQGTRYTNCFAAGSVNSSSADLGGGFVGMMCLDGAVTLSLEGSTEVNQRTVFNDCYSLGRVTAGTDVKAAFSGACGYIQMGVEDITVFLINDYYRMYVLNKENSSLVQDDYYIFRDSYYLEAPADGEIIQKADHCANAVSYADLTRMITLHQDAASDLDEAWRKAQTLAIENLEITVLKNVEVEIKLPWGGTTTTTVPKFVDSTYGEEYFDDALRSTYDILFSEGYQKGWLSDPETYPYSYALTGAVYPYPMLEDMPYYGDWIYDSASIGMGYYETYLEQEVTEDGQEIVGGTEDEEAVLHFYFDSDETSTLSKEPETIVTSDGYAVFTSEFGDVEVKIGDAAYTITAAPNKVNGKYYVYYLNDTVMDAAVEYLQKKGGYYVPLTITDAIGTAHVIYFNPNTAISQVNFASAEPAVPAQIYIRSARQFAGLGQMPGCWGEQFHYVQQFDIDAEAYEAEKETAVETALGNDQGNLTPIGNSEVSFEGSYTGKGGYVEQAGIFGFLTDEETGAVPGSDGESLGLFGYIGTNGSVQHLQIQAGTEPVAEEGETTEETGSQAAESVSVSGSAKNAGILAAVNNGYINHVDLTLYKEAELKISGDKETSVGLLAGSVGGVIVDCEVTAKEKVSINPDGSENTGNVGGFAGSVDGGAVYSSTMQFSEKVTANGANVGGFAGKMKNAIGELVYVYTNGMKLQAKNAGGFAGSTEGGSITTAAVYPGGENRNTGKESYMGGFAGNASNTSFTEISVLTTKASVLSGDVTGGLFGKAAGCTIKNSKAAGISTSESSATLFGTISGNSIAAGVAGVLDTGCVVKDTMVDLSGGTVDSAGAAAGYAVTQKGTVENGSVKMGDSANADTLADIRGDQKAAGFACDISGSVTRSYVAGAGEICAEDGSAAGFANTISGKQVTIAANYVTPVRNDTAEWYQGDGNKNLVISGTEKAAGFAGSLAKDITVSDSYVLGTVSSDHSAAGFVITNEGTIDGCTANIRIKGGSVFVGENAGVVIDCYGWYENISTESDVSAESMAAVPNAESGKYFSSYFADIDAEETGTAADTGNGAVLFDWQGQYQSMTLSGLQSKTTRNLLNGSDTVRWFTAGTYDTMPYTGDAAYPYPMLRIHRGDWSSAPQYAYGVAYYEFYRDEQENVSYVMRVMDLSGLSDENSDEGTILPAGASFDYEGTILKAGYAVFCPENMNPFKSQQTGGVFELGQKVSYTYQMNDGTSVDEVTVNLEMDDSNAAYTFYELTDTDSQTVEVTGLSGNTARITPWYADAIQIVENGTGDTDGGADSNDSNTVYELRTAKQWKMMYKNPGADFVQTHDITVSDFSDFTAVDTFTGVYNGNGNILKFVSTAATDTTDAVRVPTWIVNVGTTDENGNVTGGSISNLDIYIDYVTSPVFGNITGSVLSGIYIEASIEAINASGLLAGTASGTTFQGCVAEVHTEVGSESNELAQLIGTVNDGCVFESCHVTVITEQDVNTEGTEAAPDTEESGAGEGESIDEGGSADDSGNTGEKTGENAGAEDSGSTDASGSADDSGNSGENTGAEDSGSTDASGSTEDGGSTGSSGNGGSSTENSDAGM